MWRLKHDCLDSIGYSGALTQGEFKDLKENLNDQ